MRAEGRSAFAEVLTTEARFLAFRPVKPDLVRLGNHYLAMGLVAAWLAGMGRYYDNPNAYWFQYAGLGSVIYVFVLALLLWGILIPLRPANWSYRNVLVFVGMTAPPAILYATPIQWFLSFESARAINIGFLVIVAIWRVILLYLFLRHSARLAPFESLVAMLLPLTLVVVILTDLNLQHVTFSLMAGVEVMGTTGMETTYGIVFALTVFSGLALPFSLAGYVIVAIVRWRTAKAGSPTRGDEEAGP